MIPYFLLLFMPLILEQVVKHTSISLITRNKRQEIHWKNVAIPVFFTLFCFLLAVRAETIGRDLGNYKSIFSSIGAMPYSALFAQFREWLFRVYCWVIYNYISRDYQVFLAITAVLSILPIGYIYGQDKKFGYMKIAIFVNMSTFIMYFSGIRQGLAMSLGLLAYDAVKNKRRILFLLFTFLAFSMHHTGFMVLLMYPIYHMRFKRRDLLWIIPAIAVVVFFNRQIFNFLSVFASDMSEKYGAVATSTGAIGSFILFSLFAVFTFVISDESVMDDEAFGLRNLLVLAVVLQSFASVNNLAMRMNYYFILLIPIAIGKCVHFSKYKYRQISTAGVRVISVFFTVYFFYGIYRSYVTGISTLDTVPYIPFWKG